MIASNPESTTLIFPWQSKGRMGESRSSWVVIRIPVRPIITLIERIGPDNVILTTSRK